MRKDGLYVQNDVRFLEANYRGDCGSHFGLFGEEREEEIATEAQSP